MPLSLAARPTAAGRLVAVLIKGLWFDRVFGILLTGLSLILLGMSLLDPLLSIQELAAYLDLPVATLYAWRYRGLGPSGFRVGRHVRYRQSDVDQWINDQLATSGPSATWAHHRGRES
jgi:excisionase family DNA binding protein